MFIGAYSLLVIIFFIDMNRCPFNLTKAKSELIAEFHTEYGSFFFGLFYLSKYFYMFFYNCDSLNFVNRYLRSFLNNLISLMIFLGYFLETYSYFHTFLMTEVAVIEIVVIDGVVIEASVLVPGLIETIDVGTGVIVIATLSLAILLLFT